MHPVVNALNWLKDRTLANNPNPGNGIWIIKGEIADEEIDDDSDDGVRRIGSGYKERAELRGEGTWPCKIGRSEYANPIHRIYEQVGTGMPEKPEIALIIQTDRPLKLENAIHRLLVLDRLPDAPGTEWFMTNPSAVEEKYNIIDEYIS